MERRADLDFIKGLAIIAIILYHIGILPYGYLGVDVFLVINGFLIIPPVINKIKTDEFHYFKWLWKKLKRFLPLVIIVCAVSLIIGYLVMMPDDYENLAQSSVASEVFANNILLSITSKNYWASANEYKPLLALWFLGIIVPFYVIFPLLFLCVRKLVKNKSIEKSLLISLFIITFLSFILYIIPTFDFNQKFYYLQFRIWELCIGGCAFYFKTHNKFNTHLYIFLLFALIFILSLKPISITDINSVTIIGATDKIETISCWKYLLPILTTIFCAFLIIQNFKVNNIFNCIIYLGQMSLSLFIWNQVILAFCRYSFLDKLNLSWVFVYLIFVLIISFISYKWLEKIKIDKRRSKVFIGLSWLIVLCASLYIYYVAGVLHDVPEMGVTKANPYMVRNTEYIDRIYSHNKPFTFSSNKIKVLVIGNSFARDFACCLEEWDKNNKLEISYMLGPTKMDKRFREANFIFFFGNKKEVPHYIWENISNGCEVYGIGTKNFGKTFGTIYRRRGTNDYFDSSIPIPQLLKETNDSWSKSWGGDHYIDFVRASLNEKGEIRIFTPDSMIISFDCQHLAPAGAVFFSSRLGFDEIFKFK